MRIMVVTFQLHLFLAIVEVLRDVHINNVGKKVKNFINVTKRSDMCSDVRITAN